MTVEINKLNIMEKKNNREHKVHCNTKCHFRSQGFVCLDFNSSRCRYRASLKGVQWSLCSNPRNIIKMLTAWMSWRILISKHLPLSLTALARTNHNYTINETVYRCCFSLEFPSKSGAV